MSGTEKTSVSLPTDLAAYARRRADGNTSAYIADLIRRDQARERVLATLEEHGYVGDLALTDDGLARAREQLDRAAASRAARRRARQQAA